MDFNIEVKKFPSLMHSTIYAKGRGVMPLSQTLEEVKDSSMRKSCKSLHDFIISMLSDMYDNPDMYHLPVMKMEEFCGSKSINTVKRESPKKFKDIYSQTGNAANGYFDLLWRIGNSGKIDSKGFSISAEHMKDIEKRSKSGACPVSLDKRLEALKRIGLIAETLSNGGYCFISKKHPDMFLALSALPLDKFTMVDFRNINGKYKNTYEDYFCSLFPEQQKTAFELHEYLMKQKMRVSLNANWGVDYHFNGKQAVCIGTGNDVTRFLEVRIMMKDKNDPHTIIEKCLKNESQDLQKEAFQRITGCDAGNCVNCSTFSSGNFVTINGKKHQMCGSGIIKINWSNPVQNDISKIKRLIEIRCENIKEIK